jgi:hypothetical protein
MSRYATVRLPGSDTSAWQNPLMSDGVASRYRRRTRILIDAGPSPPIPVWVLALALNEGSIYGTLRLVQQLLPI